MVDYNQVQDLPEVLVTPNAPELSQAPVSINTDVAPDPISLDTGAGTAVTPSTELATKRAKKTMFGLGDVLGTTEEQLIQDYSNGQEDAVRRQAASKLDLQNKILKQKQITDLSNAKKGQPLSSDEVAAITEPLNQPVDPETVVEQAYGSKYVGALDKAADNVGNTIWDTAKQEIPNQVSALRSIGSTVTAKREFARTQLENIDEIIKNQSWVGFGADLAKQLVPLYNDVKLRGLMEDTPAFKGVLLGNNLFEQTVELYKLPLPQFKTKLKTILDKLKEANPHLASQYAQAVIGMSSSEIVMNNFFTPLDLETIGSVAAGGVSLMRKASVYNRSQQAVKTMIKNGNVPEQTAANVAESAGDVGQAAVSSVAARRVENLAGRENVVTQMLDDLTTQFNIFKDNIKDNPGSLSREAVTRLEDQVVATQDRFKNVAANVLRIQRTPVALEEANAKIVQESIKDLFPGKGNTILDIEGPFHNKLTNTYDFDVKIGKNNAELFDSPETAAAYAKANGYGDAVIEQSQGRMTFPSTTDSVSLPRRKLKVDVVSEGQTITGQPAAVKQQGLGYYIVIRKPLNETDHVIRDLLLQSTNAESSSNKNATQWRSRANSILGWVRGADDTLAFNESVQRKVATYATSEFQKVANEEGKFLSDIARGRIRVDPVTGEKYPWYIRESKSLIGILKKGQVFDEFERTLKYARTAIDEETGKPGYFFKTPGELEDHYMRSYERLPSFIEQQGYFAFVRNYEYDLMLRKINTFHNKSRLGSEQHSFSTYNDKGEKVSSDFIEGMFKKELPGGDDPIYIMGNKLGKERLERTDDPKIRKELAKDVKAGRKKVIEIYDPERTPLKTFPGLNRGSDRIRYVVSENVESKPLSINNQIDRRGGGHFEYDYSHYIKQASMRAQSINGRFNHWYEGDVTLMPIDNLPMGKDVVKHLEQVRTLLKNGDFAGAKAYSTKNLPVEWKEVRSWFRKQKNPITGEILEPRFSLKEPFYVVPKDKAIIDLDKSLEARYIGKDGKSTFRDGTKSGSAARQFQVKYTGERDSYDMFTFANKGTRFNPQYSLETAALTDPIPTMTRALNRIINSTYMDDYKAYAIEHWLRENESLLNPSINDLRSQPFWHFEHPDWKKGQAFDRISNAQSNRYKIKQFVGVPDKFDTFMQSMTQSLVDAAYSKFGPVESRNVLEKAFTVVPLAMLARVKDPITVLRSLAYNAKLGLFALPQILVQSQSYVTIAALSPGHVMQGTAGALFHQWSRFNKNPEFLEKLDQYATKMGWKAGEWKEAMTELGNVGFGHVGGEYAALDDFFKHTFVKGSVKSFLSLGQVFFKGSERNVRYGAWYTAFHEFRKENPLGRLTDADRGHILNRADDLYTNMSRASASSLHGGIASMTTQFLSYQLRLTELFMSKRIGETLQDRTMARARLLFGYAAMYGVPGAFGLTGMPFGDYLRKEAIESGYVVGENFTKTLFMEGIPSILLNLATGGVSKDGIDIQKGNFYNFSNRFGVQGISLFRDALRSDPPWWKMLGGASASIFANTIANMDGATRAFMSIIKGDQKAFPLKIDDFVDIFKEISSVSAAWKAIVAANTGKWMSKNEAWLTDTSTANALFMAASGLSPQGADDLFVKGWSHKDEQESQKYALKRFIEEMRRGFQSKLDNPEGNYPEYFRRASAILEAFGYPMDKRGTAVALASKGYESQISSADYDFYLKDVPTKNFFGPFTTDSQNENTRFEAYRKTLQVNKKREQP